MPWVLFFKDPTERLDDITFQLERVLKNMSDVETRLTAVVTGLQGTVVQVVDLIGQVLTKFNETDADIDISDELTSLEGLQSDLQNAADNLEENLNASSGSSEPLNEGSPPEEDLVA